MKDILFSEKFACPDCGISIGELEPRMFSFNAPYGKCDYCDGLGTLFEIDEKLVIPNKKLSIYDDDTTIIYRGYLNDCDGVFNGTVIFTKMDELGYVSLSNNDVDLILKHLCKLPNGLFEMRYSIDNTYQSFDC